MNQEAQFALRFVVKDLAKIRKATDEMNKRLADMGKRANTASKGINKVQGSFRKATVAIGKFALAYFALSKMISTVFSKAAESIQIDMMADSAGVAADKIGKLGKALRVYGGDAKTAGSAYMNLTNIIGGATHGRGLSEDITRVNAMYGIGFNYGNISQDQLMTNIAVAMQKLRNKGDQWGINQIASAYGIDASMANFLSEQGANWSNKANREKWEKLSKSETRQLIEAEEALKTAYENAMNNLAPTLTSVLNALGILTPAVESIAKVLNMTWWERQGESVGKWWYNTFNKKAPEEQPDITPEAYSQYQFGLYKQGKISYDKYIDLVEKFRQQKYDGGWDKANEIIPSPSSMIEQKGSYTGDATLRLTVEATSQNKNTQVKDVKYERNVQLAPTK